MKFWGQVPWRDRTTAALCPKQGLETKTRLHSTFPWRNGYSRLRQQKSRRQESLQLIPEKDFYSAELETMRISKHPTTVMTANDEVQTREDATVYVKQVDLFVKVMLLEETPAVLSLGKLCEDQWVYPPLDQRSKTTSHQTWQENWLQFIKLCAFRNPWFFYEFLCNAHTFFIIIFMTGFRIWRQQIHRKSSTRKKWKVRVRCYGESRCINRQKPKTKNSKWRTRKSTKSSVAWLARLAAGVQRKFGRWM